MGASQVNNINMKRCKNCGVSIPNTSDGFCSEKCKKDFSGHYDWSQMNPTGAFNLIAIAVERCFTEEVRHDKKDIRDNREFLEGQLVQAFCDCSDNLNQERVIKMYDKLTIKKTL